MILVENNKYQEAVTVLKPLADADPGNETIAQALATAYEEIDEIDQAIQVLRAATALHNDRVPLLRHLGTLLVNTNDIEGAIQTIDQALKVDRSPSLLNLRGILVAIQDNESEAIQYFKEAIELDPQNVPAYRNLAQAYLLEGEIESAMEVADRGLELSPNSEEMLSIKAQILKESGQPDEALSILEKLVSNSQSRARHIINYYVTLLRLGRKEQALNIMREEYQSVSEKQREIFLQAIESVGIELYREGNAGISKQLYEQVLQIVPNQARSINNLGFILISERSWLDAQELLQRAEKEGYEDPTILKANQGYIALNLDKVQNAIELFNEALKCLENIGEEEDPSALLHVAYPWIDGLAENRGDDYPTRFVSIRTSVLANLACAHYLLEDKEQALNFAQRAIESDPEESTGYRMLGCLYFLQGDYEQARQAWERALESRLSQDEDAIIRNWLEGLKDQ
ncbi:MAG: tetratricopeptide repeat protein [Chloroflexi bacterium]|nr:tetratricopeptide repeat protein [Chloroflexota bacterium]